LSEELKWGKPCYSFKKGNVAIQGPGTCFANLPHHIRAFDVRGGRQLAKGRLFAVVSPGIPDGLKVDI
jgi:gluconolactonase